tara:strand:- start:1654 stop:2631 length:978 start_codon:yes stop_codon:yes gene_type:complete
MICKYYEIKKLKNKINYYLFYGENEGHKDDVITYNFNNFSKENTYKYNEKEIIENKEDFFENIYSKSFFENEKLIIVSNSSDKILNIIKEIIESDVKDIVIILVAKILEKKSKLRNFFEKEKNISIVPFYADTFQTLTTIAKEYLNKNKISLSQENLNLIIERSQGDRINLKNELEKILSLSKNKKKIDLNDILRLTNLSENYSASELVDSCLCKNKKKTLNILNENISTLDDNIQILKTFLYKLKRLKQLKINQNKNNDIEKTINSSRPPIFWKDKDNVKLQMKIWNLNDIQEFIINLNDTEYLVKENPQISNEIVNNLILERL